MERSTGTQITRMLCACLHVQHAQTRTRDSCGSPPCRPGLGSDQPLEVSFAFVSAHVRVCARECAVNACAPAQACACARVGARDCLAALASKALRLLEQDGPCTLLFVHLDNTRRLEVNVYRLVRLRGEPLEREVIARLALFALDLPFGNLKLAHCARTAIRYILVPVTPHLARRANADVIRPFHQETLTIFARRALCGPR